MSSELVSFAKAIMYFVAGVELPYSWSCDRLLPVSHDRRE